MSNREFMKTNKIFIECCKEMDVKITKRQVSKFRNKKGKAFKALSLRGNNE